jgi:hypothetical protein
MTSESGTIADRLRMEEQIFARAKLTKPDL